MDSATYFRRLNAIEDKIPGMERTDFNLQFSAQKKSVEVAFILSLFFGTFGLDRLYLGQIGLALLKLITCGGGGIWTAIDWFLIMGEARAKNIEIAESIRFNEDYGVL